MKNQWWKEGVYYQIYPKSFNDANGDGIGDLNGIREKSDYLKELGVNILWLSPIFDSPHADNGYDISDFYNIWPSFGSMDDFDELLEATHKKGMKLILDIVLNHTSEEHPWFLESVASKDNPYRDFYHWQEGNGDHPPNNWESFFSEDAWTKYPATDEYYLHLFTKNQPDLNWENPEMRKKLYDILHFWLKKGVDGFRLDVIPLISKIPGYPDNTFTDFNETIERVYANGPRLHEHLNEMYNEVFAHYDAVTLGEGIGVSPDLAPLYVSDKRDELNMVYHFDHMNLDCGPGGRYDNKPWSLKELKAVISDWDESMAGDGWYAWYLGNHDFGRKVTRFGSQKYWEKSAKLLAVLLLSQRAASIIYQGDEIGMTNIRFESIEEHDDIATHNAYRKIVKEGGDLNHFWESIYMNGRDNARTPVQWDDSDYAGFSTHEPWLKVNPNYTSINVKHQSADNQSILHFYKKLVEIRRQYPTLVYGQWKDHFPDHEQLFVYSRISEDQQVLIALNLSDETQELQLVPNLGQMDKKLLLSNYEKGSETTLRPWEAVMYEIL